MFVCRTQEPVYYLRRISSFKYYSGRKFKESILCAVTGLKIHKMYRILFLAVFLVVGEAVEKKTDCQEHRERELRSNAPLPMRLIPECDQKGDYKPRQCFKDSKFCACWDKNGHPVSQPSKKIKACDCLVQKHQAEKKGLLGAFKPQCEDDGKFKKIQCHSSTGHCWCAHPETGAETSKPARGRPKC